MSKRLDSETTEQEVVALLGQDDDNRLRAVLRDLHPADVADILDSLEDIEAKLRIFAVLDPDTASETIRNVHEQTQGLLVERLSDARISAVIERLDSDDATDLLSELPEDRRKLLLDRASPETSRDVQELLTYAEDTAGGIMKTEVAAVREVATVGEVTDYIRRHSDDFHDVHNVFVTDPDNRLLGLVPLRKLLLAADDTGVGVIMETETVAVGVDMDQEEVAHLAEKYDLLSLPVVDDQKRLVGRITIDDIVDVIEEEATEDMLALAGVGHEPLAPLGALETMRSRFPWLGLNLLTATAGAATIALFEETIREVAIAAGLMTIVASQGGNAGVQTMTLIVRGLALGELRPAQAWRILGGECLAALGNGVLLGALSGLIVYLWRGNLALSLVLSSAMVINLVIAAVVGSLVPLGFKVLRIDPAISSSVLVITTTDILGFFVFLGLLTMVV